MVFLTPISTLSKSMNTAIRVLLVVDVGIFTSTFTCLDQSRGAGRMPGSIRRIEIRLVHYRRRTKPGAANYRSDRSPLNEPFEPSGTFRTVQTIRTIRTT